MSIESSSILSKRAALLMPLVNTEYKSKIFDAVTNVDSIENVAEPYKAWLKDFSAIPDDAKWLTPNQEMQKENPPFSKEIMEALKNRKRKG